MQKLLYITALLLFSTISKAANKLYWNNQADNQAGAGSIQVGSQAGITPAINLFPGESSPCGVTIHGAGNKIYWGSAGGVRSANLDGSGIPITLYNDIDVCGVAADPVGGNIYWANADNEIRVAKLNGNGAITTLFSGATNAGTNGLTIDQKRIYWTNSAANEIRWGLKSNIDSTQPGNLLYSNELTAKGIALSPSGQTLYWTNSNPAGQIRTARLIIDENATGNNQVRAGEVSTLYHNENTPTGISIDISCGKIYWANSSTGDIRMGSIDGSLPAVSLYSLQNNPSYPIILQAPQAYQEPRLIPSCKEDECGNTKPVLYCSSAYFTGDNFPSFLYKVGVMSFSWFLNGTQVATTIRNQFTPPGPGSYTCEATSRNPAGECTMASR